MANRCPNCKGELKPLFQTLFCPNGCENKVIKETATEKEKISCPKCNSKNTGPFPRNRGWIGVWNYTDHCWDCGAIW